MKKTFKYRIGANKDTFARAQKVLELCRTLYNLCLDQRKQSWKSYQKSISKNNQIKQLPDLKNGSPEFKQVPSQTLQDVVERVDKAFLGFFRRIKSGEKPGYPRFKGFDRYDSWTLKQAGWKLKDKYLTIQKIGKFNIKLSRPIEGTIKTVTIRKTLSGKWYVCFSCDNVPTKPLPKTNKQIGIDVGCESFLTDSNARKIDNPRFFKKSQDILTMRQQKLSCKKKGSNRRKKAKILVAKIYEKILNQRKDFHFKTANQLLKENDVVCIEKLNSWNTWRGLNRSMRDVAWFNFFSILKAKAEEAGRQIVEVPARGTSQICSRCGKEVPKDLSVRIHNCPFCHLVIDRDYNSALNILRLGQSLRIASSLNPRIPRL
jgi:putative transposase